MKGYWRDPEATAARDRRRLALYRRHRRVRRRRLSARSPTARRTSSCCPAATMSRRRGSRASWCCSPRSRRRWSMATATRIWSRCSCPTRISPRTGPTRNNAADDLAALADDAGFHQAVGAAVDRVNANLPPLERIRRFAVLPESLHHRQRDADPVAEDPPPQDPRTWGDTIEKLYERSSRGVSPLDRHPGLGRDPLSAAKRFARWTPAQGRGDDMDNSATSAGYTGASRRPGNSPGVPSTTASPPAAGRPSRRSWRIRCCA